MLHVLKLAQIRREHRYRSNEPHILGRIDFTEAAPDHGEGRPTGALHHQVQPTSFRSVRPDDAAQRVP